VITGVVVASIVGVLASLIAYRWRINLQRREFDRSMESVDTAYVWGGTAGLKAMTDAINVVLFRTTPEPHLQRRWPLLGLHKVTMPENPRRVPRLGKS
jgi:hypothetical protein